MNYEGNINLDFNLKISKPIEIEYQNIILEKNNEN